MADGPRGRIPRPERSHRVRELDAAQDGVAHRAQLRALGVTRDDVRSEVRAGRWRTVGRHTVALRAGSPPSDLARWWWAVWEAGPGAYLDGAAALVAAGLTGFRPRVIDVSLPHANRARPLPGVRVRRTRHPSLLVRTGVPRAAPEQASVRAAAWAVSDRQAALLLCLPVQQRLVHPDRLDAARDVLPRSGRGRLVSRLMRDIAGGAHSLGELNVAVLCRRAGLPEPLRQAVHQLPTGRVYLDAEWPEHGLVLEVDGVHHDMGLTPVADAFRQNELTISGRRVLRVPLVAVRLAPDQLVDQLARALAAPAA